MIDTYLPHVEGGRKWMDHPLLMLFVLSLKPRTDKSIDFERHATAPEILLVLTVGFDPRGHFVGGFNFSN